MSNRFSSIKSLLLLTNTISFCLQDFITLKRLVHRIRARACGYCLHIRVCVIWNVRSGREYLQQAKTLCDTQHQIDFLLWLYSRVFTRWFIFFNKWLVIEIEVVQHLAIILHTPIKLNFYLLKRNWNRLPVRKEFYSKVSLKLTFKGDIYDFEVQVEDIYYIKCPTCFMFK